VTADLCSSRGMRGCDNVAAVVCVSVVRAPVGENDLKSPLGSPSLVQACLMHNCIEAQ
jgi:hypothetical protein